MDGLPDSYTQEECVCINLYNEKDDPLNQTPTQSSRAIVDIIKSHFPNCNRKNPPFLDVGAILAPKIVFDSDPKSIRECPLLRTPIEETFYGKVFLKYFRGWDIRHFIQLASNRWDKYSVEKLFYNTKNEDVETNHNRIILLKKYIALEIGKGMFLTEKIMSLYDLYENGELEIINEIYDDISSTDMPTLVRTAIMDPSPGYLSIKLMQDTYEHAREKILSLSPDEFEQLKTLPDFVLFHGNFAYHITDKFFITEYLEHNVLHLPTLRIRRDPIPIIQIEI
jgi:hypothetical protein